ncbi:MAG: pyridoxal phosphate-dependent aminotransferase [Calditrichia bacterium]|nr:pyridoxal phosphate-dependent aminotransferase [Calditrichia bacterium]
MPRFPKFSDRLLQLSGSVFEKFLPKMREKGADLVKLHIGDSYLPPPYELPVDPQFLAAHPHFNRYCNTMGVPELREALAEKVNTDNGLKATADDIMLTAGASNALTVSMMSIVNPGEEVLVLTPCWPFFPGMVKLAGGVVREVSLYSRLYAEPELSIEELLAAQLSDKTVAIYLNSPNNPSGKVLNRTQLASVAAFAKKHSLWLLSDEAYDGMTFDGNEHISVGSFPGMFEQTLSIFTFSKVFMFAGLRLGYIAAPHELLKQMNKALVHILYSPSTLAQQMMVEPVKQRKTWSSAFVEHCHELRDIISGGLEIPHIVPEGGYYLFFDMSPNLFGRDYWQLIDDCLEAGVSIAPGKDFGNDFHSYIRICFAGESPDRLKIAADRLNSVLLP